MEKTINTIRGRDVFDYVNSPFQLYCKKLVDKKHQDPYDPFQDLLGKAGNTFEQEIIKKWPKKVLELPDVFEDKKFELMIEAMKKGVKAIHKAPLLLEKEDMVGQADLIEKHNTHSSHFGDFHYIVYEIKSHKPISEADRIQCAFYTYILGKIQGYTPEKFILINSKEKRFEYSYREHEKELIYVFLGIKRILARKVLPRPIYNGSKYPWKNYTNESAIKLKEVSLVQGARGKTAPKIWEIGIKTVKGLALIKKEKLMKIKGIGEKTAETLLMNAKVLYTNKPVIYNKEKLKLPKAKEEVYVDFETTSESEEDGIPEVVYLIGILYLKDGKWTYLPLVAENMKGSVKDIFKCFIAFVKEHSQAVFYTWTGFEMSWLEEMFKQFKTPLKDREFVMKRMFDLAKPFQEGIAMPTYSNRIKDIAPWMGFDWRQDDVNGTNSMFLYFEYLREKDRKVLQKVLDYNEDDVVAMRVVRDWLKKENGV